MAFGRRVLVAKPAGAHAAIGMRLVDKLHLPFIMVRDAKPSINDSATTLHNCDTSRNNLSGEGMAKRADFSLEHVR